MSNEEKNENINIDVDEIMKQITDFSEKLHMKNRHNMYTCYSAYISYCFICS